MTITSFTMDFHQENKKHRRMVFHKMEQLVKQMSDPSNGIQVRTQKQFLTTIPKAFTGSDLIDWLMKKLDITELNEVYHLASLLCHYGYIFPITDTKSLSVKEDGSLYRFQCPYYWPQSDMSSDNEAYAIHLTKRSMRNKQKHGLEDYEQAALNRLKTMYSDKWNMINTQAENQVQIAKEKKKIDKMICDSQERAFWRVHKPAPGQIKSFEEQSKRNFSPSQITAKKESKEYLQNKVNNLTASLEKPRMRMSKVIESYQNRVDQYHDFDPFFCPPHPSNPWITDDTTAWTASSNCDQPTEKRVKMWSFGLHELLSDRAGLVCFESFLRKEFSHENIHFWLACKALKSCAQSQVASKVEKIYEDFLARGARCEINIDCKTMEEVQTNLKKKLSRYTFDPAQSHIYTLMKKDSYARFLRSDEYKTLLANAVQPTGKKKFSLLRVLISSLALKLWAELERRLAMALIMFSGTLAKQVEELHEWGTESKAFYTSTCNYSRES
ncbi:regulator of G-protein signaling 7 [Octopus sinensis]|uniref:Regulator of G-protein signaling 7 n=1 Tax=Octopus sinensis TaxID=2607531 RepID=A0A6P7TZ40_9MOLL|nr:regulator of G-protein signaling 7 [Octopus sinensis]